ncbi:MAG TPA: biotin-dependent carboxyltransferase family protein [Flavisolibacter sp.]|jgi:antagonist of KipI
MSLKIIRAGILDTVQDLGRRGYQHLGINPGGAADRFSAALANALLGNELNSPVLELHFPAASLLFSKPAAVCITGADFSPTLNGEALPVGHPFIVAQGQSLRFLRPVAGARCYVAVWNGLKADEWLGSHSTHLKVGAGGWQGRPLRQGDEIPFSGEMHFPGDAHPSFRLLPWSYHAPVSSGEIEILPGRDWYELTIPAQELVQNEAFFITSQADRMGCRLSGKPLEAKSHEQMVSSGVSFGTVQLLPDGQLMVLMADHQTTGGYPIVAQVNSTSLSLLAQKKSGEELRFRLTELEEAEKTLYGQEKYLRELKNACKLKMQNFLHAY